MSEPGIPETFAAYGWELTPEWLERYNTDPWVYNLTNALVDAHRRALSARESCQDDRHTADPTSPSGSTGDS